MSDIHYPTSQSLFPPALAVPKSLHDTYETRLETLVTKNGFFRTWFATSANLQPTPDTAVKWGIHWVTPVTIISMFLLGTMSAIGHHVFYSELHDTLAGNEARQRWVFWIGSSMGFLTKVSLSAVVGMSRTQWVWLTLRKKWMTLGGIDALFGISSDPTFIRNGNMLRRAKAATVMAILMWMYPLAAILTPGTISVETVPHIDTIPCGVRSLLFEIDPNPTARRLSDDSVGANVIVLNTGAWSTDKQPPEANTPTLLITVERVLIRSAYNGIIARPSDLKPDTISNDSSLAQNCGQNCTYTVKFFGPAIICPVYTSWGRGKIPWDSAVDFLGGSGYRGLGPFGNGSFLVGMGSDEFAYAVLCQKSIALYTVQQTIENRHFLEPVITRVEQSQYPVPESSPKYPETKYLAITSLFAVLIKTLSGEMKAGASIETNMVLTPLLDDVMRNPFSLGTSIEIMAQKMIVSLLSFEETSTDGSIYILDATAIQKTACTTSTYRGIYVYSAMTLLLVYGLAVASALLMAVAGFFALGENGMASGSNVSTIIRTTRNTTLDESIVGGSCLGGCPVPEELKKLELQFGLLRGGVGASGGVRGRRSSFAFGVKGQIDPINKAPQA